MPWEVSVLGSSIYMTLRQFPSLTLLHSERPKLHTILAFLSAKGLKIQIRECIYAV